MPTRCPSTWQAQACSCACSAASARRGIVLVHSASHAPGCCVSRQAARPCASRPACTSDRQGFGFGIQGRYQMQLVGMS